MSFFKWIKNYFAELKLFTMICNLSIFFLKRKTKKQNENREKTVQVQIQKDYSLNTSCTLHLSRSQQYTNNFILSNELKFMAISEF